MARLKLAICVEDGTYRERFVKCLMNHYREKYEFYVFESYQAFLREDRGQYDAFVLEGSSFEELGWEESKKEQTILLCEENKYWEVYKIMEGLESLPKAGYHKTGAEQAERRKVIGIFSFTTPHLQIPFAATMGTILGETQKTILIDLQEYSGLEISREEKEQLGLEDMMAIATSGNYTKGRLLAAIEHHPPWDYVCPVKNSGCLLEGNSRVIRAVVELLTKELGYETVMINFGTTLVGLDEMPELCDDFYLLCSKGEVGAWREQHFVNEMERRGKTNVLDRICRIEIPSVSGADGDWERIAGQWKWGSVGDSLRRLIRAAKHSDTEDLHG